MSKAEPTPAEIEEMRATVAAADAKAAAQRAADRAEHLAPLAAFIESPAYAEVRDAARALAPQYRDDREIRVHLDPLADFMLRLTGIATMPASPPVG